MVDTLGDEVDAHRFEKRDLQRTHGATRRVLVLSPSLSRHGPDHTSKSPWTAYVLIDVRIRSYDSKRTLRFAAWHCRDFRVFCQTGILGRSGRSVLWRDWRKVKFRRATPPTQTTIGILQSLVIRATLQANTVDMGRSHRAHMPAVSCAMRTCVLLLQQCFSPARRRAGKSRQARRVAGSSASRREMRTSYGVYRAGPALPAAVTYT